MRAERGAIEPDIKDWTWVLSRPCPECGFDAAAVHHTAVGEHIRRDAAEWLRRLQEEPRFPNWDQDETAITDDYASQDPATGAGELFDAANTVADTYAKVCPDAWLRRGLRSNGSEFTIASIAIYHLHDVVHHAYHVNPERRD